MGRTEHEKKWQRQHGRVVRTLLLPSLYNRTQFLEIPERLWKSQAELEAWCLEWDVKLSVSLRWMLYTAEANTASLHWTNPLSFRVMIQANPSRFSISTVQYFPNKYWDWKRYTDIHLLHYVGTGRVKITLWSWGIVASCIWLHE